MPTKSYLTQGCFIAFDLYPMDSQKGQCQEFHFNDPDSFDYARVSDFFFAHRKGDFWLSMGTPCCLVPLLERNSSAALPFFPPKTFLERLIVAFALRLLNDIFHMMLLYINVENLHPQIDAFMYLKPTQDMKTKQTSLLIEAKTRPKNIHLPGKSRYITPNQKCQKMTKHDKSMTTTDKKATASVVGGLLDGFLFFSTARRFWGHQSWRVLVPRDRRIGSQLPAGLIGWLAEKKSKRNSKREISFFFF